MPRFTKVVGFPLLIVLITFGLGWSAQDAWANGNDPYGEGLKMGKGSRLQGEPLDTSERRSYREIPKDEAANYVDIKKFPPKDYLYVANYWHLDRFYVAAIPVDLDVKQAILQVVYFVPQDVMHHMQGRFDHPKTPILLFQQTTDKDPHFKPISIDSSTISLEAVGTVRFPADFGVKNGLDGSLAASHRLMSSETKTRMLVYDLHQETRQYPLVFTGDRLNNFWKFALGAFYDPEMTKVYHFLKYNCTNSWFSVIDRFMAKNSDSFLNRSLRSIPFELRGSFLYASNISLAVPTWIKMHLNRRGVISYANPYPNLDVEVGGPTPEAWNTCPTLLLNGAKDFVKNTVSRIKKVTGFPGMPYEG
ncbi:MAG: hypothetical protein H7301_09075 [Cryobacterium sp.]|nr:hypothetical protein [Oligoflexia bacterium]